MAHIAVDIDGTISAAPSELQGLCSAMMAVGHRVTILTGTANDVANQSEWDKKAAYLSSLGMAESYNDMTVVAGDIAAAKCAYCRDNGVDIAIDNSKDNAKLMMQYVPCVLVPWASRT